MTCSGPEQESRLRRFQEHLKQAAKLPFIMLLIFSSAIISTLLTLIGLRVFEYVVVKYLVESWGK